MKTSDLIGPALDWAVAKCEGAENLRENPHRFDARLIAKLSGRTVFMHELRFSTEWAQGGPIIEREGIDMVSVGLKNCKASMPVGTVAYGPNGLIAAMRCYVASKLGDEVEIPEELK